MRNPKEQLETRDASAPSSRPAPPDARMRWTDFALHPLRHEVPVAWHPLVTQWTKRSARVRWETLTGTPLDLNWTWLAAAPGDDREPTRKRLEDAWTRESAAAESQAKTLNIPFRWEDDASPVGAFANLEAEGSVRSFCWNGRPGCLAVLSLAAPGRRAFLSASLCPPGAAGDGATWKQIARRVLRSLKLAAETEPLRVALAGVALELPAEFLVEGLRGREGQLYLDCHAPESRVGLARIGLSDLRLAGVAQEKVWWSLARLLFERGEAQDPVETLVRAGAAAQELHFRAGRAAASPAEVHAHAGGLFLEKCRLHVRAGDWLMRKLRRPWSGRAAALAWTCSETHALWAVSVRCGAGDAGAAAREILRGVSCHGRPEQELLDWHPFVKAEATPEAGPGGAAMPEQGTHPWPKQKSTAATLPSPLEMRRRQLRFRVRVRPEVRLEISSKDGTGDLVYPGAPAQGFLAGLLRGRAKPEVLMRRLALDPVGRRIWELLAIDPAPSAGEVLANLCGAYGLHPVEAFPRLLEFLRMLGERRLAEGVPEEPSAKA